MKKDIINYLKLNGFFFPNAEIYNGLAKSWDLGSNGTLLKNNLKNIWWKYFISTSPFNIGSDSCIITSSKVLEASGHKQNFCDWLLDCLDCKKRHRLDNLISEEDFLVFTKLGNLKNNEKIKCPSCKNSNLTEPRKFNLLLSTNLGSTEKNVDSVYLRPETCQGIFVNFLTLQKTSRKKLPFGVGQIGKSFRNEITLNHGIFRTREFEQMELEFFCKEEESEKWWNYWVDKSWNFLDNIISGKEKIRKEELLKESLPHYARKTTDFFFDYHFGWGELCSNSHRGNFDLENHSNFSNKFLGIEKEIPNVVEISFGVERLMLAILQDSYHEEELVEKKREVLRINPLLSPYFIAIIPLRKNFRSAAFNLYEIILKNSMFNVTYEESDNIGKSYRRQDAIGTYYCLTIDSEEAENLTLRKRDDMSQISINKNNVIDYLKKDYEKLFEKFINH